ncbi:hypothetical protein GCM10019059_05490 [Camelimonas fluminis]|nr:hypothetical protein GCM10019059_05490 [Camelimonas fluminis]
MTEANAALLVAHDHESGEAETATTLHDLGDTIDMYKAINEFAVALALFARLPVSCHNHLTFAGCGPRSLKQMFAAMPLWAKRQKG